MYFFFNFNFFFKDLFKFFGFVFGFLEIFEIFGFFLSLGIPFNLTKVTTKSYQGYYWAQKIVKNGPKQHNKLLFLPKGQKKASAKGQSHPQELEVGPHSGPYLLVKVKLLKKIVYKESTFFLSKWKSFQIFLTAVDRLFFSVGAILKHFEKAHKLFYVKTNFDFNQVIFHLDNLK